MSVGKASRKKKVSTKEALGNQGRHEKELKPSKQSPSKSNLQKTTSIITFIPILILLLVSFVAYFNALFGDFVYDDMTQIVENPWIKDVKSIPTFFFKGVWSFQGATSNYYRPLMHFIYMVNYHVFGLKPLGFHLVNILFHCGNSFLVFLIIRRFFTKRSASTSSVYLSPPFIAAMLFATHPIHTEAVTWIAGLPDVSFTFFYLLSLYLYISFRDGGKGSYLWSVLSFSAATLLKEPALTLTILLIAYDSLFKKSDATILTCLKRYTPYIAVSVVYLFVRYYVLGSFAPSESYADITTYQYIINVFPLFREYLTSLLWPFNLNFWHTFHPIRSLFEANGMISILVSVIFVIAAMAAYRKNKLLFFALLLLFIPLLPVFYIKGIAGKPFAERYLYLPSVGFVILLATSLSWAKDKLPHAVMSITTVFIIIMGLYCFGTITRNNVWQDDFKLWTDTVKKSPDSDLPHSYLGREYALKGQIDMAIAELQTAVRLSPNLIEAHNNLGIGYAFKGLVDMAIAEFQTVLLLDPDYVKAHYNLGVAYSSKDQLDMAMAEFQRTLRLNPDYGKAAEAHYNLARIYQRKGNTDMARKEIEMSLNINPDHYEARRLLNDILSKQH